MLIALAAIWGSSFMFIRVAVRELSPADVVLGRVLVGAVVLLPAVPFVLGWRRMLAELRRFALPLVVLAIFNASLPFWLLAWSEKRLDSGLAAVLQASTPLFTALLALGFSRGDRVTGGRLVGVVIGFLGVVLLVGALPIGIAQLPDQMPGWKAIGSVVALGSLGLSVAYLLYFALIARAGASYAVLVTYLVPALALGYGAVFLDETITAVALGGLALILAGVALGTGTLRIPRRAPVGETP